MDDEFPILPFRSSLYSPAELFEGFEVADPTSYGRTIDFRTYRSTRLAAGRDIGMLRALHDQSMTEARNEFIATHRVVAIMGGHGMSRDDKAYSAVARLAWTLSSAGLVIVSGGGPGAMEAAHLGAVHARSSVAALDSAVAHLAGNEPRFPVDAAWVVGPGGDVSTEALAHLHAWQSPAFEVLEGLNPVDRAPSLAVPTWFYGHEPPTPFATHIAKYFSNPLREDGLLAMGTDGVVYAPGSAGTLQEVFQDAAQNFYRTFDDRFSPMVFLDVEGHWSRRFPVAGILRELFGEDEFERWILTTGSGDDAASFLISLGGGEP